MHALLPVDFSYCSKLRLCLLTEGIVNKQEVLKYGFSSKNVNLRNSYIGLEYFLDSTSEF